MQPASDLQDSLMSESSRLSVLHVFRSPKGGLFRHVCDLVEGQAAAGIRVGILCDSLEGDDEADRILARLEALCELGVNRVPFSRNPSISDLKVGMALYRAHRSSEIDILHGHGAKGGTVARLMARPLGAKAVYTPHGGALHFDNGTLSGSLYLKVESALRYRTHGVIFESAFAQKVYEEKIGQVPSESRVIYNGLRESEFADLDTGADVADFLFFGELRLLKGIEPLIKAAHRLKRETNFSMIMAGSGPDHELLDQMIREHDLHEQIKVVDPIYPATAALVKARCIVLPSLAESLPYAVLEALAAGKPVITTSVGGIPEIFGDKAGFLVEPGDDEALFKKMNHFFTSPTEFDGIFADLRHSVSVRFSYERMVNGVQEFYQQVLSSKRAEGVYSLE